MGTSDGRKLLDSLLKMNTTTCLSILLAVITLATPAQPSEPRVVCYYTNWSVYRPGTAKFNPQNINPYLCTHLIYAFGGFTKDNTLKPFDKYQDIEKGGYAKFTGLKTYNKNLKTLLAIGGWNEGSTRFSPMVASRERRKEFVRNAIKFLRQNRFDGLDLDWEYPAFRDGGKPKDREHYAKLVRELREEFDREAEKTGRPRLLLTMAVPAGIEYIQKGFDVQTLNQYLDWMNLLTYDYHSAFEPAVNHHAPLYPLEEPNEYSVDNELNIDYTIKFYLESGADRDKLVLGIPTYGRSYTLFNADATEIGAPADGPGEQGDATREKGYLAYYEICEALKPKEQKKRSNDDSDEDSEEEEEEPWTVMTPNPDAMGPVAYKGNQWVGYDDIDIVKKKAEYVAENGLGGIMFWSIDNDDFRGNCHGKPYPLIEAAKEAYIVKLGSTDNAIATERSRTVTTARSSSRRKSRPRPTSTTTTQRPSSAAKSNKRKSGSVTSTTPTWNIVTPEPPTTPDPGSDFKCTDEGFYQHPRDCKKYFWCLDSGPSNLGIVAHQFTCPSGLFFNKAADSCDFARNVPCKKPSATTKAPVTEAPTTTTSSTSTTRRPVKLSTKSSVLFRTTSTTTPEPEEEEYEDDVSGDIADIDAEDPKVIKELIDLIKKVGGVEQLEKHLHLGDSSGSTDGAITTTPSPFNKKLYQKVLERTRGKTKLSNSNALYESLSQNSRRGPQNAGLEQTSDKDKLLRKDRPQYTTIQRARPSTSTTLDPLTDEDSEEDIQIAPQIQRARAAEPNFSAGTTTKPLQYVNIRRARPTSDTADDTASRNALFERPESIVTVSEPNSLDIGSARRENMPEYVTIRRQRPTTEEITTAQYENTEQEVESLDTALEREISSPSTQPQYTSIVRSRPTTSPPEDLSTPEPTTVLAVQISSLLNSASSSEEGPETTVAEATEVDATTTSTTSTTTTTPVPSSSAPPRRTILRRRGSTTTTSSTPAPSTTQPAKRNFPRRTKSTGPPDTTEPDTIETTTGKYTRRGISKFKTRKESQKDSAKDAGNELRRRPYLNNGASRSERPTRNFVRRRIGGANATSSTSPSPLPLVSSTAIPPPSSSRRPFRVASRRRISTTTSTTTESTTTASSEESLQDIGDTDPIEDPLLLERTPKTPKIQRRPLILKEEEDQNPSATNDDERKKANKIISNDDDKKRQSKKYSSSFKQNQLDEVLRQKAKSQEELDVDVTTEGTITTIDDFSAETALAIAAHQLLAAPIPIIPNYDEDTKPTKKSNPHTTEEYRFTSPDYTELYTGSKIYTDDYSSSPIYKTTVTQDYVPTSTLDYSLSSAVYDTPRTSSSSVAPKSSAYPSSAFTGRVSRPSGFSTPKVLSSLGISQNSVPSTVSSYSSTRGLQYSTSPTSTSEYSSTRDPLFSGPVRGTEFSTGPTRTVYTSTHSEYTLPTRGTQFPTRSSDFTSTRGTDYSSTRGTDYSSTRASDFSSPSAIDSEFPRGRATFSASQRPTSGSPEVSRSPSTVRYLGTSENLIPVPVEDYSLSPEGYSSLSQEPAYFTREYLLESPVTKTYDDEYQYLSPVTTQQTTTRKIPKKTIYRKISTTIRPTLPPVEVTTPKPRRVPQKKPFEKLAKPEPNRTYRPIENYDYYDDSQEKMVQKYAEGTKVILHGKGTIECLDIGNFPHPSSCKKFISCARLENGSLLGWEYVCPKGLSFDPVGGICNWSAGLGCEESDVDK